MTLPDPDRLAAADLHGRRGTGRRRRIVRAELILSALGCVAFGALLIVQGDALWTLVGVALLGIAVNYVMLARAAIRLSRPGALDRAMAGLDVDTELRAATRTQLWILIPFSLCLGPARTVMTRR